MVYTMRNHQLEDHVNDLFGEKQTESSKPLRPHQERAVRDIRASFCAGHRRVLYQCPTGGGKTRIMAEIVRLGREKQSRIVLLAPRRELVYQIRDALKGEGVDAGIIMAGEPRSLYADVFVCSFDTLHARAIQREKIQLPRADMVLVDEGHLAVADSRKEILESYPDCRHVLFTATPARGDGRGLREIADDLVLGPSIRELVAQGYLLPLRYYAPSKPDLREAKLNRQGDYQIKGIDKAMNRPALVGDIVGHWERLARDRSTVVFCCTRAHSRHMAEEFQRRGYTAEHLDGETPPQERAAILARVDSGQTQILCNVFVASYGLDIPRLSCAVVARPTKDLTLYLQTIGRVMRPFEDQVDGIVIDHAGCVEENGLADDFHPWSLDGKEKIKDRMQAAKEKGGEPKDITCQKCKHVFRSSRTCPKCGHEAVPPTEEIPVHKAVLQEVKRTDEDSAAKRNRTTPAERKAQMFAEMQRYGIDKGKAPGWAAHTYRAMFGVWPNAHRDVRPAASVGPEVAGFIRHRNIAYARRRA